MKIDIFAHILPPKYKETLFKEIETKFSKSAKHFYSTLNVLPTLFDLDLRFRIMDKFDDLIQVLTLSMPPVENIGDPNRAADLAKMANDEMAELVTNHPDRFAAAIACLPMNDIEAAMNETDRAIKDLKFRGVQIFTPTNDKPLDSPEFMPLYEKMCQYNLPILLHPQRHSNFPDYKGEESSKYTIHGMLGWPYETSMAMVRLVFSGILETFKGLKIITHHSGAMIPYFEKRIVGWIDSHDTLLGRKDAEKLRSPMIDYFKMFYADTALYGHSSGLMCCYDFFGADHMVFGTDMPWDSQLGLKYTRETIESIEQMAISDAEKKMIFEDNARNLFCLSI
jgi:predicted TIM-barrel fold metal-dependent hydrolase